MSAGTEGWTLEKKFRNEFSNRSGDADSFDVRSDVPMINREW